MAPRTTAFSSYLTYLMIYNETTGVADWQRLVNIKSLPDLGGSPEQLETTTLSNAMNTYCSGIQSFDSLTFTCNYTKGQYDNVKIVADGKTTFSYAVFIGDDSTGEDGTFYFNGVASIAKTGVGVNEVQEMTLTIAPATDITNTAPTGAALKGVDTTKTGYTSWVAATDSDS